MQQAPYGTWQSNISADYLASRSIRLSETQWCAGELYWVESQPREKGRQTVVRLGTDGTPQPLLPSPWDARSRVHEYGGGHYCISEEWLFFVHAADQQIYALDRETQGITAVTAETDCRFADLYYHAQSRMLYAVCEDYRGQVTYPENILVQLRLDSEWPVSLEIIEASHDFVSNPRVSPCGNWLSYLTWDHPQMPWDGGLVWIRAINPDGTVGQALEVAGGTEESVFQPQWSPGGDLFWVSDRNNWWNLQRLPHASLGEVCYRRHTSEIESVWAMEAEFATPQWVFGMSTYGFLDDHTVLATYSDAGIWHLVKIERQDQRWTLKPLHPECNAIAHVSAADGHGAFIGASPYHPPAVFKVHNDQVHAVAHREQTLPTEDISTARSVRFDCNNNIDSAFAFFYPPTNSQFVAPEKTLPPLIVMGHGGPTGASDPSFSYKVQFWTSRGFAVMDVNYRGSTGYGRRFRQALDGQWGVYDVDDLCSAAEYAVERGWVDPTQLVIRGSSAGGFSVLAALTDRNTFHAGVCLYGIADLELLAQDTHKFESRYVDGLIGPYPEAKELYVNRSPIHKVNQIQCPLLVFQGLLDKVVPPNQAEILVNSVKERGIPVAYVKYAEEGHGFRGAETVHHQVSMELAFYQTIFHLGTPVEDIHIANWPIEQREIL